MCFFPSLCIALFQLVLNPALVIFLAIAKLLLESEPAETFRQLCCIVSSTVGIELNWDSQVAMSVSVNKHISYL